RRGGACRRAVSFVLPRRTDPQPELVGSRAPSGAAKNHRRIHGARRRGARVSEARPISILVAALGGGGRGVLPDWIGGAAAELGFPVQSTSIPGVAQRTGATTYYIEIVPLPARELPGVRCWRSPLASATSTSCWPASCWKPAAPSVRVS